MPKCYSSYVTPVLSSLRVCAPWVEKSVCWITRQWLDSVKILKAYESDDRIYPIKYESLVMNPEAEIGLICDFLGEEFVPAMIHNRSESIKFTATSDEWARRQHRKVLEDPITSASLKRWRKELSPFQTAIIEHMAKRQMETYGYELVMRGFTLRQSVYWYLVTKPSYDVRRLIWRFDRVARGIIRRVTPFCCVTLMRKTASWFSPEKRTHAR